MAGLKVKKYSGDARMAELLSECGCSRPLDFVKAAVLGAQSSAEEFGVDSVARELLDGRKGVRVTEELISELEGLWYLLLGSSRFPASDHIALNITTTGRDTVSGFVSRQVDAGDEFLKYLHHGRTQDFFDAPKLKKIYSVFNGNLEILRALHGSMNEKWSDEDFRDMESLARKLNSFIKVYWDSIVAIKELVKSKKLEKMKNRSIIRDIESQLQREIGRNDPCPCGSGKKYKACCGR